MTERICYLDGNMIDANQNAFGILGEVSGYFRQLGVDRKVIKEFQTTCCKMSNSDFLDYVTATTGITFVGRQT